MRAPDSTSCPGWTSASELAHGGLPAPVEGPVPVWAVLSCLFFFLGGGGGRRVPGWSGLFEGRGHGHKYHLPWPPELPAPPWPSKLPAPPWPPFYLFCSGGPRPVFLSVCVLRGFQCAPPGGTVKARDAPSGRGELCQSSVVCVMCSRFMFPYLVCFLSLFNVIIS